jgi:hypothetical protein
MLTGFVRKESEWQWMPPMQAPAEGFQKEGQNPQSGHPFLGRTLKICGWMALGFLVYPLLFVPIMVKLFPQVFEPYILIYAEYLRLWGI